MVRSQGSLVFGFRLVYNQRLRFLRTYMGDTYPNHNTLVSPHVESLVSAM